MSDESAIGSQPHQVILWRSRSNGTVRVSNNSMTDSTGRPLNYDGTETNDPTGDVSAEGLGLVVGRPLPLEIRPRPPSGEAPPVLETCPYCFQIMPQEDPGVPGSRSRSFSHPWNSGSPTRGSVLDSQTLADLDEPRILAVDPLRKQRRTQMLLTRPYFRMLERVAADTTHGFGSSSGPSSVRSTRESSRRGSIDTYVEADAPTDRDQATAGMEGYYKRYVCNVTQM
jgi:hypothetical protein